MILPLMLSRYIARRVAVWFCVFLAALIVITLVADTIELLRRSGARPDVGYGAILEIVLLRLPYTVQGLLPFALLLGAIMAFWRLSRAHEMTAVRAGGMSIWQILTPAILVALTLGAGKLLFLNTVSAVTLARSELLEARAMRNQTAAVTVAAGGFWLRQSSEEGVTIIHAGAVTGDLTVMTAVLVLRFDRQGQFVSRLDAARARLEPGRWVFEQATQADGQYPQRAVGTVTVGTDFTVKKIQENFTGPDQMPFWSLPDFIAQLDRSGFSSVRHRLYFHAQLAAPLLMVAMVLIAATFSLRPTREGRVGVMIGSGVLIGFVVYFLSYLVQSLGQGMHLPVMLAAWAPAVVSTLVGLVMLLHLEDG